jgi:hypothetical protein
MYELDPKRMADDPIIKAALELYKIEGPQRKLTAEDFKAFVDAIDIEPLLREAWERLDDPLYDNVFGPQPRNPEV